MQVQIFYRRVGMNEEWLHADETGALTYTVGRQGSRKAGVEGNAKILSVSEAKGMFPARSGEIDQAIRAAKIAD